MNRLYRLLFISLLIAGIAVPSAFAYATDSDFACSDGRDNDSDSLIDYPSDPGCDSAEDNNEYNRRLYQCEDGIDNDNDGLVDSNDPGCRGIFDNSEGSSSILTGSSSKGSSKSPIWRAQPTRSVSWGEHISFTVSARGGGLTYSVVDLPSGASFDAEDRRFSWTPTRDDLGFNLVRLRASNGVSLPADISFYIQVISSTSASNDNPPQFVDNKTSYTVDFGEDISFTVHAADLDGDVLSFNSYNLPEGATFNQATKRFYWRPNSAQIGRYYVQFMVSDGVHHNGSLEVSIKVRDRARDDDFRSYSFVENNRSPYFDSEPNVVAFVNRLYSYDIDAVDPEGFYLRYELKSAPTGAQIDRETGVVTWVADSSFSGARLPFIVQAVDNKGNATSQSFNVFVSSLEPEAGTEQVLGASTDLPGFPNTGAGEPSANRLLFPLGFIALLSFAGLYFVARKTTEFN